ncbi:MAG TPA: hypothetical protein VJG31_02520 [Candidatus Nanoarchaeia archaeon]|nr:hypothetical protein [Candidatus Nanoarchaeia archaeon]
MLIVNKMRDALKIKARNYFLLGSIALRLGMPSEAATNFFKALFAVDDSVLFDKLKVEPKDRTERFDLLRKNNPELYSITDRMFHTYRRTYTQELNEEEVILVRKRVMEAFENAKLAIPADEEVKNKFEELLKKRKLFG